MLVQNEGQVDRMIRIVAGIVLILMGATVFTGLLQTIANIAGILALGTGSIGFCAIYALFGITTKPKGQKVEVRHG